ncbi:MAG TPA: hypothetical protein VF765_18040 [Polyangiaceae bacterium]
MSNKVPSPLLGYNNNVRHKGRVFHIQTEDSGVKYGHIITHLFMDGGRILKSVKTSYAEYIGNDRMGDIVREMMKQQHKAMFIALRDGKFDSIAEGAADASQMTRALAAESPPSQPPPPPREVTPPPPPPPAAAKPAVPPPPPKAPTPSPPAAAARPAPAPPPPAPPADEPDGPPTVRQAAPAELSLEMDALDRAAAANAASPVLRSASDLPPPPANLFREKNASGKYRITPMPPAAAVSAEVPPAPRAPGAGQGAPARPAPAAGSGSSPERRYAPTRPAAVFGQARPQQGKSIFGEDLISDKSLDEVILSYLAEDLEEKK